MPICPNLLMLSQAQQKKRKTKNRGGAKKNKIVKDHQKVPFSLHVVWTSKEVFMETEWTAANETVSQTCR